MKLKNFFEEFADESGVSFKMASEVTERIPSISTGSYILDDMIGCNGYPCGRIIQLYGPAGSGKTLLTMLAIKEAQLKDPEAQQIFLDAEQTFNPEWAEKLGIDLERVGLVDSDVASSGQQLFELLLGVPKEDSKTHFFAGWKKEGLLEKIAQKKLNCNLAVLDSLGAISAPQEEVSMVGKMNMAPLPRFLTTTFKKLSLQVSKAKLPFIVINHKRDTLDPYSSSDHSYAGGNSYRHSLSANLYVESIQRKDAAILNDKEEKVGHSMRVTLEKSKFSPWPRKCEFKVNFNIGIVNKHEEVAALALKYDVVTRPSNVTYTFQDRKWVGESKFHEGLANDPELTQTILQQIFQKRDGQLEISSNVDKDFESPPEEEIQIKKAKKDK